MLYKGNKGKEIHVTHRLVRTEATQPAVQSLQRGLLGGLAEDPRANFAPAKASPAVKTLSLAVRRAWQSEGPRAGMLLLLLLLVVMTQWDYLYRHAIDHQEGADSKCDWTFPTNYLDSPKRQVGCNMY